MQQAKRQKLDEDDKHPFNFPFPPYSIQEDLMKQIYQTISQSKIGIFESPTGTGKSLSLICGVLTWLRDNTDERGALLSLESNDTSSTDEPDWFRTYQTPSESVSRQTLNDFCMKLDAIRENPTRSRIRDTRMMHEEKLSIKPSGSLTSKEKKPDDDDEVHIVPAYESDPDTSKTNDSDDEDGLKWFQDEPKDYGIVQIFYCSRTHSQLSQFIHEIKKTEFGKSIRTLTLGARKSLCINPDVRKLNTDTGMRDKCLDMIQSTKSNGKCPYNKRKTQSIYRQHALAQVQDIEELHELGEKMSSCAYYGTRAAIPLAQVIAMPYSMLLSKSTRESMGINLAKNIVIFDEAHNIADAVNHTYSVGITGQCVSDIYGSIVLREFHVVDTN